MLNPMRTVMPSNHPRPQSPHVHARPVPPQQPPLQRDSLVEIVAGDHRGLCGWVREIVVDTAGAADCTVWCTIELQGGEFVRAERCEVSPVPVR